MMRALDPEPLALPKPDGIVNVLIDPISGLRADSPARTRWSCRRARLGARGSAPLRIRRGRRRRADQAAAEELDGSACLKISG